MIDSNSRPVANVCLKKGYGVDKPPGNDKVTTVYNAFIRQKVLGMGEKEGTVTIEIKQLTIWKECRIKTNVKMCNAEIKLKSNPNAINPYPIWTPDSHPNIDNLKERKALYTSGFSELMISPNNPIREFNPNTTLIFATHEFKATVSCAFNFSSFPLDTQHCPFRTGSTGPGGDIINVLYDPDNKGYHSMKEYETSEFDIIVKFVGSPLTQESSTDKFGFDIEMKRHIESYFFQYYLPCMSIVMVSLISFIVPLSAIPGRIALVVTQFLTLTNIFIHQMVSDILPNIPIRIIG